PVFVKEFSALGLPVQTINMPTLVNGAQRRLTDSGSATSDGFLTLSANGQYLTLGGYDAAVGTAGVASSDPATVNRIIARIDLGGNVDTSTAITDGGALNIRSTVTNDGSTMWFVAGGSAGSGGAVRYTSVGTQG